MTVNVEFEMEKLRRVLDHIQNVQRNCIKLGTQLIKDGHGQFGRQLIANGFKHDSSKLSGIEWDHLHPGDSQLSNIIRHHNTTNMHHPEYWGSIFHMPELYLAEMACDLVARSQEFGTNVRQWLTEDGYAKYKLSPTDSPAIKLNGFIDILVSKPFTAEQQK